MKFPALPIVISMFYRLVYNLSYFFWALFLLDKGFLATEVGLILGVNSIVSLVASVPSGFANDRFSSRHLMQLGLVLFMTQLGLVFYFDSFLVILLAFVLSGIGQRLVDISIDSFVLRVQKQLQKKGFMSWFLVLRFVGIGIGMLVGTYLLGEVGFDGIIKASFVGLILIFAASFFFATKVKTELSFGDLWQDLKDVKVAFFMITLAIFALHFGAEVVAYVPFLKNVLLLEGWHIGAYMSTGIFIMGFASFYFSRAIEKGVPSGYFLVIGLLVSGIFHMAMVVPNVGLSLLARVIHEVGDAAVFTFMYHGLAELFPERSLSSNFGVLTFLTVVATGISSFVYGYVMDISSVSVPLFVSGFVSVLVAIVIVAGLKWLPKIRHRLFN
ncbi:hypothetical protein COV81_02095 [Candidatus Peregrinibacteria bacterium CG11_big_fil_rev_8_21_14_0_20_41_10]|nr:MAG: hypothetical protein COV81_02095 [Candidatus Peregrinibacteria bacterium CG11_big_fil_rev_8_21_14_0_20_41_10]PIZ76345.1 MAG: hypothetical protein COY06_02110 [Candidatus Peregrinibacteria bacterium CG_4_10_14_0_2_um_filter_41_8]PJC37624.1 MAG: hypothetical protein CO045_04535 [Candidatus Peregrinibacteria bacterium CG_4_9_14_0_2_um_filter_41_14]